MNHLHKVIDSPSCCCGATTCPCDCTLSTFTLHFPGAYNMYNVTLDLTKINCAGDVLASWYAPLYVYPNGSSISTVNVQCINGCWVVSWSACLYVPPGPPHDFTQVVLSYKSSPFDCGVCPADDEYDTSAVVPSPSIGSVSVILA